MWIEVVMQRDVRKMKRVRDRRKEQKPLQVPPIQKFNFPLSLSKTHTLSLSKNHQMGNYITACTIAFSPEIKTTKASRVIFPTGEIRQFQTSVKAAEIMLDCPNFFIVNSQSLTINRRFSPLAADDDLESGNVYVMFPMRRVNSMVTPGDMAVVWLSANSAPKRISGKVSPAVVSGGDAVVDEAEQPRLVVDVAEFGHRLVVSRSKKPFLDTITEEPVRCK